MGLNSMMMTGPELLSYFTDCISNSSLNVHFHSKHSLICSCHPKHALWMSPGIWLPVLSEVSFLSPHFSPNHVTHPSLLFLFLWSHLLHLTHQVLFHLTLLFLFLPPCLAVTVLNTLPVGFIPFNYYCSYPSS